MQKTRNLYLVLENGRIFKGKAFGFQDFHECVGEIVFTTGMSGCIESLTDPSYYGQIVVQNFPLGGDTGVIYEDSESRRPWLKAFIVREHSLHPSNFRKDTTLDEYLSSHHIPGIYGIDTRELAKIIRRTGVMNGLITFDNPSDNLPEIIAKLIKPYTIQSPVNSVSIQQKEFHKTDDALFNVALWDFGAKDSILRELLKRRCNVTILPCNTTAEEILAMNPDGLMLSNGPGDPADNAGIIAELHELLSANIPIFGICLGHQLLAMANGAEREKLKFGHRGLNQPVLYEETGKIYITSQNHGYAILTDSIPGGTAAQSFTNLNDGTCEGIEYKNAPAFSVQFHPEACAGPLDTGFLFETFIRNMEVNKHALR